ncbi:MAG: hypothetical protein BalsKO_00310 [Balneolaceae bacterium]
MKKKSPLLVLTLILTFSTLVHAQTYEFISTLQEALDTKTQVLITLKNNNNYTGEVISIDEESVAVETDDGVFNIIYERIKSVRILDANDPTSGWFDNPASNKLFISQSGKMLEPGSGYYQNTLIFFSNFAYGVSKNLSLSLGFSMIPDLGIENQLYAIGVKTGTTLNEHFDLSASLRYYTLLDEGVGITSIFSSLTYSNKKLDLTGGAGFGFAEGNSSDLLLIFGGQYRLTQRFAFVSENVLLPSVDKGVISITSIGGRLISKRSAFDLGFFVPEDADLFIPFASYAIKF